MFARGPTRVVIRRPSARNEDCARGASSFPTCPSPLRHTRGARLTSMNSRSSLRPFRALACWLAIITACLAAERRPNFLFVYTDDQRWDAMSVVQREQGERGRFPWFQTPNMDRL